MHNTSNIHQTGSTPQMSASADHRELRRRMQERRYLAGALGIVLVGLILLFLVLSRSFDEVSVRLEQGTMVNLSTMESSEALHRVLAVVYRDPADQRLVAEHIYGYILSQRDAHPFGWHMPNVGYLNTQVLAIPAEQIREQGQVLKARVAPSPNPGTGVSEKPIRLFERSSDLQRVKPSLVVRSPDRFRWLFAGIVLVYVLTFVGVHQDRSSRRHIGDPALLPVVALLTGLGLLLMFSLQDPLRDLLRAQDYVVGILGAGVAMALVSRIDFQADVWHRRPSIWLALALGLALLLFLLGSGPTGSTAKINLELPLLGSVQPVEGIKLCMILFLAGYFARHWKLVRSLDQRHRHLLVQRWVRMPRFQDIAPVMLGVLGALLLFVALRDMGPALVLAFLFLVLYGMVRQSAFVVFAGAALLFATFALTYTTDLVPLVADRVQMLLQPWENFVYGGDHLAHAFWAMATGGLTGQGLGMGHPQFIPAAHTDMVLPALAEEMGWVGLLLVLALYAFLFVRAMRVAVQARGMFSFFLAVSIGLVIMVQVILIGAGSVGMLPLSGVVTPFISYGKSSMVVHGILIGILFSIGARGEKGERPTTQHRAFRVPVHAVLAGVVVLLLAIAVRAACIQVLWAADWTTKPALVVRSGGERAYAYNPRIAAARSQLQRGTIYDRQGVPLALSNWDDLEAFRPVYEQLGITVDGLNRHHQRFYPFHPLTLYALGDINTRVKWGADNSLYAEHRYLSQLRGYDNYPEAVEKRTAPLGETASVTRYDYRDLTSLVRYGDLHPTARALITQDRDVYLTLDIRLQAKVAEALAAGTPEGKTSTAVVLDTRTGEVLASVTYPLPDQALTDPEAAHRDPNLFDRGYGAGAKPPGSTFKLVTALAALEKDADALVWTTEVSKDDRYARRGEPTGTVRMDRAIYASSNVYFADLAESVVGEADLFRMMQTFGFETGTNVDLAEQRARLEGRGNLRQAGFGQGPVIGTPLDAAVLAATIAKDGRRPAVQWTRTLGASTPEQVQVVQSVHAKQVAAFMRKTVTHPRGTAHALNTNAVAIAGKTGTAEEVGFREVRGQTQRVTLNHAWFTGFAPYSPGRTSVAADEPQLAVAVLVEEGGHGGQVAAPIAGAIFEAAADLSLIPRQQGDGNP